MSHFDYDEESKSQVDHLSVRSFQAFLKRIHLVSFGHLVALVTGSYL